MDRYFDEKLKVWITVCPPGAAWGSDTRRYKDSSNVAQIADRPTGPPAVNYGGPKPKSDLRQPKNGKPKKRRWAY